MKIIKKIIISLAIIWVLWSNIAYYNQYTPQLKELYKILTDKAVKNK